MHFFPKNQLSREKDFEIFCSNFFELLSQETSNQKIDFIGTLLMWQVSGANTSSIRAYNKDIWDERVRAAMTIAHDIIGTKAGKLAVNTLRTLDMPLYYGMGRMEGAFSLGIHDIETIMIVRGLFNLKETVPEYWSQISKYLEERSPEFFKRLPDFISAYEDYDTVLEQITSHVSQSKNVQDYLKQFYSQDKLKSFLCDGESVDGYQFSRTTAYWATISKLDQLVTAKAYNPYSKELEQRALVETIDYYLEQGSLTGFFLDQIANPKMVEQLKSDSEKGNQTAKYLMGLSRLLSVKSDLVIAADRDIAESLISEETEEDIEFQIITGVAHSRWLLNDAYKHVNGQYAEELTFKNPNELAYYAFLATSNREAAPSYQIAATRPLERATLTFAQPQVLFETMDQFISGVYSQFEETHPQQDFKSFVRYMSYLVEEIYFPQLIGTHRYQLEDNELIEEFIEAAEQFGAYKTIITPPHCSWMRSLEATTGYIAEITKKPHKDLDVLPLSLAIFFLFPLL